MGDKKSVPITLILGFVCLLFIPFLAIPKVWDWWEKWNNWLEMDAETSSPLSNTENDNRVKKYYPPLYINKDISYVQRLLRSYVYFYQCWVADVISQFRNKRNHKDTSKPTSEMVNSPVDNLGDIASHKRIISRGKR